MLRVVRRQCAWRTWLAPPLLSGLLWTGDARAVPAHVRLRGAARIDAQGVKGDGGDLILRGALTDDAGAPLSEGALVISIAQAPPAAPGSPVSSASSGGSSSGGSLVALPGGAATACTADGRAPRLFADGIHVATDAAGRFCVRVALPVERYVAHIGYAGGGYIDAGATDVQVDLSRRTCTLAFAPAPPSPLPIRLDTPFVSVEATATLEGDAGALAGAGMPLTLWSDREGSAHGAGPVATATTDATGHARFTLPPLTLGPAGRGELRVEFAGSHEAAPASRVVAVERRAQVELDVPDAHDANAQGKRLPAGSPEDGVPLTVTARAAGGEVTSGSIEARVGDTMVGAAPVEAGTSKLVVTFGSGDASSTGADALITLRYVPSVPWYEAGADSTWRLPLRARSPLRQAWVLLGAIAVAAWFVLGRIQRAKGPLKAPPRPRAAPRGEAKLDLVRAARSAGEGWRGRLTDADDETAIGGARIQVERPAFGRAELLGTTLTDDDGRFELVGIEPRPGDELTLEAPLHVPLRRPLPPAGELEAQLVLRRRALLGRIVVWAKFRGRPFDARPEPTPGHVRRAAGDDFRVARWADAVERAAFAGEPVDARIEAEVDRLAPGPTGAAAAAEARPGADRRALANPTKANR